MKDLNKVILLGRLGADPVQRETKSGLAVVHFSLATSRKILAQDEGGEEKEETQWHRVVVWGKHAEACKLYLDKGHQVFVEGTIRSRKYTSQDGNPRVTFEVHAENVIFLGRKRKPEESPVTEAALAAAEA
jgi:single-strand DNA-binding protein